MLKNKKDIILIVCMFLGLTVLGFTYKYLTSTNEKKAVEIFTMKANSKIKKTLQKIKIKIQKYMYILMEK